MNILITGGKSAIAFKIAKAFVGNTVILADYGEMPQMSGGNYQLESLGTLDPDVIAHRMLTLCLDWGVDAVLPLYSLELEALAKAKVLFEEFNIRLFVPDGLNFSYDRKVKGIIKENWGIFYEGTSVFVLNSDSDQQSRALSSQITGLFQFNVEEPVANWQIITI